MNNICENHGHISDWGKCPNCEPNKWYNDGVQGNTPPLDWSLAGPGAVVTPEKIIELVTELEKWCSKVRKSVHG